MNKITLTLFLAILIFLESCVNAKDEVTIITVSTNTQSMEGSCPHLAKDPKGNIVLSWIKKLDSTQSVYCYALSMDNGHSFEKTITIPGSENIHPNGENMPKVIFKASGEIIAAWPAANPNAKNKYSDIIFYTQSFDEGQTWTERKKLVIDTAGYDQRYFDMAILSNGEAAMVWLDNRKNTTHEGSGLFFASTKGENGFQNEHIVAEPACECCRTALLVDSKNNIHLVYRAILNDSIRDMVHAWSTDNGKTFSSPKEISHDEWVVYGCPHTGPAITENKNGLHFSWFTGGDGAGVYYSQSVDNGQTFSPRRTITGSGSRHSQIAAIGENTATVWNENFIRGKQVNTRIGMEIANEKGEPVYHSFITPETGTATFPVIKPIDKNSVFVAYTVTEYGKDFIKSAIISSP